MIDIAANIPILVSVLAFLATFFFLLGIVGYSRQRTRKLELREKIGQGWKQAHDQDTADRSAPPKGDAKKRPRRFLSSLGKHVVSEKSGEYSRTRAALLKAGFRRANAPHIFWGAKCLFAICLLVGFLALHVTVLGIFNPTKSLALCFLLALAGFYLPNLWLRIRIHRRKRKIFEGLPDALDLLVVCVEAGMGLDAAINRVAKEIELRNKVLSEELNVLNLELRAGKLRRDALKNLAMRTDLEDLNSLATLLIQTDKFGTSIAQALRVYSDTFRTKRYQRAEEIASKLPVKLVFPLIAFIFPSLFVAILGPAFIRVYHMFLHGS